MNLKCPICGSDDIIREADVTIRFRRDDEGNIMLVSDYADILEEICDGEPRTVMGECQNCFGCFWEEN